MPPKKISLYLVSVLLFMLILPVVSITLECLNHHSPSGWLLIGKWFIFWSVGARLFIAGIRQASSPGFTAHKIFHLEGTGSFIIIRELGFANISIGLGGLLSLYRPDWAPLMATIGGLFFGLAGIQHLVKKPQSANERLAMVSDLFIFLLLCLYLIFTF